MLPYTVSDSFCVLAEITLQKTPSSAASRAMRGILVVLLSLNTRRTSFSSWGLYTCASAPPGNTSRRPASDLGAAKTVPTMPDSATQPSSKIATWEQTSFTTLI